MKCFVMSIQSIPKRVANKLQIIISKLVGVDLLTKVSVAKREDLREIGSSYGGWVIPTALIDEESVVYCVGCGEDITFDLGLIDKFQCHVYGFDPTPRAIEFVRKVANNQAKYHFSEYGLWDEDTVLKFYTPKVSDHVSHSLVNLQKTSDYIEVEVKRLSHVMTELGHRQIDLLKLDIEGAEYKVIDSIIDDGLDIKVICVEYDECFNPIDDNYTARIKESVHRLVKANYKLVCVQGRGNYTFVRL